MNKIEIRKKELNSKFTNINNYDSSNIIFNYSDSNNNQNDIISKAKESIYKFQNQISPKIETNKIKKFTSQGIGYSTSESGISSTNYNYNIYPKNNFYPDLQLNDKEYTLLSNFNNNPDKNIFQANNNNYKSTPDNKTDNISTILNLNTKNI